MIDLTPLDVRKKKGDFTRALRGYEPREVDHFLDTVAERLEEVVKVNLTLRERVDRLSERVQGQEGRERAVQEALVTAQSLKHDIQEQAKREAELIKREAESEAEEARAGIKREVAERRQELIDLSRARARFLKGFRSLLEREMDSVEVAEANVPSDELDLDVLRFGRGSTRPGAGAGEVAAAAPAVSVDRDPAEGAGVEAIAEPIESEERIAEAASADEEPATEGAGPEDVEEEGGVVAPLVSKEPEAAGVGVEPPIESEPEEAGAEGGEDAPTREVAEEVDADGESSGVSAETEVMESEEERWGAR